MKIGMLVNNLEVSGGYQKLVIRFSQHLIKLGHDVTVYTPKLDRAKCYPGEIDNLKIVTVPKKFANVTPVESYAVLTKKIDSDYDCMIIHDELSLIGVGLLPQPPKTIVWMLNNQLSVDLIKYSPEMRSVYKHTVGTLSTKISELKKAAQRIHLMRKGVHRVSQFVTYDNYNMTLVNTVLKRDATNVYAGADLEQFKQYAKSRSFNEKKNYNVLSVGVVFPHRRYEDLIGAADLLVKAGTKNVQITIVGRQDLSPEYFKMLENLVTKLNVTKYVKFISYVTDKEMIDLYRDSDVFAFINDGFTWGISVFEAVAAKLPVIITSNIGAADLIADKVSGRVVKPQSPDEVATAITDMIEKRQNAKKYAETAYTDVVDIVSWQAYTKRMLQVINDD